MVVSNTAYAHHHGQVFVTGRYPELSTHTKVRLLGIWRNYNPVSTRDERQMYWRRNVFDQTVPPSAYFTQNVACRWAYRLCRWCGTTGLSLSESVSGSNTGSSKLTQGRVNVSIIMQVALRLWISVWWKAWSNEEASHQGETIRNKHEHH